MNPLRILSSSWLSDQYHAVLYAPLIRDVVARPACIAPRKLDPKLPPLNCWDLFHLHWPEWLLPCQLEQHKEMIAKVEASGLKIVWTMHNLVPHDRDPAWHSIYQAWASATTAVIHHSKWGEMQALSRYQYAESVTHCVIPHFHFGSLLTDSSSDSRFAVEAQLGLRHDVLRLGVIGAPRPEKRTDIVVNAVTRASRSDLELVILCDPDAEEHHKLRRIIPFPNKRVPRSTFNRRLSLLDVIVLPFDQGDMLTTGAVAEAVGLALPSLTSDWPFLHETLGEAAIPYGSAELQLRNCIDSLTEDQLFAARQAARNLQQYHSPERLAIPLLELLRRIHAGGR